MRRVPCLLVALVSLTIMPALYAASKPLQIYFIDVEGGQATLMVNPRGESLLVDTGFPGFNGRDADRIVTAAKAAGLKQIDYVLITHYHNDHVGGLAQLADRIKVGTLVDHGPNMEDTDSMRKQYAAYEKIAAEHKHLVLKPGDQLPFKGMKVQVLTAAGEHIQSPLPGANQPNPVCSSEPEAAADT